MFRKYVLRNCPNSDFLIYPKTKQSLNLLVFRAVISVLALLFFGCAANPSPENSRGPSTIGDKLQGGQDSVTSGGVSPVIWDPIEIPILEMEINRFRTVEKSKQDPITKIYPWTLKRRGATFTNSTSSYILTIGNHGRILAFPKEALDNEPYFLGSVDGKEGIMDFASNGLVAFVAKTGISIFSIPRAAIIATLNRLNTRIATLKFSLDGDSLYIGGADGMVYNWRFAAELKDEDADRPEKLVHRYPGSSSVVNAIGFHPGGRVFFTGDWHGDVVAWQRYGTDKYEGQYDKNISGQRFFTGKHVRNRFRIGNGTGVSHLISDQEGAYLYVGLFDGTIEVWKQRGIKAVASIKGHDGQIIDMSLTKDGKTLVTVGKDGHLKLWRLSSSKVIVEVKIKKKQLLSMALKSANKKKNENSAESQKATTGSLDLESSSSLTPNQVVKPALPETMKRIETQYELKALDDLRISGITSASFFGSDPLYVGDKTGRVMQIERKEIIQNLDQ